MKYLRRYNESYPIPSKNFWEPSPEDIERMFNIQLEGQNEFNISNCELTSMESYKYPDKIMFDVYLLIDFEDNEKIVELYNSMRKKYKDNKRWQMSAYETEKVVTQLIKPIFDKISKKYDFIISDWKINILWENWTESSGTTYIEKCDVNFSMILNDINNFK